MGAEPVAALSQAKAATRGPLGGHQGTGDALAIDQQARDSGQPEGAAGARPQGDWLEQLRRCAEQGHQQQGCGQMGGDDVKAQQLRHGQRTKGALGRHQQQGRTAEPGQPAGLRRPLQQRDGQQHHQPDANQKGIEAVKPLQEHLEVHLTRRQQRPVAKGPVRAGQSSFHHAGGATDGDERDQCHHQLTAQGRC